MKLLKLTDYKNGGLELINKDEIVTVAPYEIVDYTYESCGLFFVKSVCKTNSTFVTQIRFKNKMTTYVKESVEDILRMLEV